MVHHRIFRALPSSVNIGSRGVRLQWFVDAIGKFLWFPTSQPPSPARSRSLERTILDAMPAIEHWFRNAMDGTAAPFYTSVDLRNSGFKLAPVDTNLFPGGFNNLNPDFLPLCVQAAMSAVEKICPDTQRFLLVPENHTRNMFYLQNVVALRKILRKRGSRRAHRHADSRHHRSRRPLRITQRRDN